MVSSKCFIGNNILSVELSIDLVVNFCGFTLFPSHALYYNSKCHFCMIHYVMHLYNGIKVISLFFSLTLLDGKFVICFFFLLYFYFFYFKQYIWKKVMSKTNFIYKKSSEQTNKHDKPSKPIWKSLFLPHRTLSYSEVSDIQSSQIKLPKVSLSFLVLTFWGKN